MAPTSPLVTMLLQKSSGVHVLRLLMIDERLHPERGGVTADMSRHYPAIEGEGVVEVVPTSGMSLVEGDGASDDVLDEVDVALGECAEVEEVLVREEVSFSDDEGPSMSDGVVELGVMNPELLVGVCAVLIDGVQEVASLVYLAVEGDAVVVEEVVRVAEGASEGSGVTVLVTVVLSEWRREVFFQNSDQRIFVAYYKPAYQQLLGQSPPEGLEQEARSLA